jgi:hypothetical protein
VRTTILALLAALVLLPGLAVAQSSVQWPTLRSQLERDHVPPGSALARFIEENQDFSLLDPRELRDEIRIPLWLRVQWRKAHPDFRYDASDPTGGYPYVLKEAHEWMREHPDLQPGQREEDLAPGADRTVVGPNMRISGAQSAPRSESDIRINFNNPQRIISASNNISGSGRQAIFYTFNGGTSWGQTTLPLVTGDAFHSDPTVDWTSDGTAWSTTIGINASATQLRMRAYKSTDGGATWTFDATFSGSQTQADKQMKWIDHSASSPFKDYIYVTWHNGAPAYFNRRTGPNGSWGSPVRLSGSESTGTAIGADIKTNAFGDVFALWPTTGNRRIFMRKSTNGGASWGSAVQVASLYDSFEIGIPAFNSRKALIYVSAGAYRTASKNMVYAVWNDLSGETGCTSGSQEPGSNVNSNCKSRIWFARSTNGGSTWSTPVKINNPSGRNDQFNPWLAVDETTGRLGVMYYDTVADPGRKKTDVWYQTSTDDGATWSPALKVTTAMTDETVAGADTGNQYGDYNGLSGYANTFFASWTDRRNNAREEIWTASLTEGGGCTPPPAPTSLTATAVGTGRIDLAWVAAPGAAEYHVYRSTTSGSGYGQVGTTTGTTFQDTGLTGGVTYYYVVRSFAGCESGNSNEAFATAQGGGCSVSTLYTHNFETGSGLSDWTRGTFVAGGTTATWRGIQACTAKSGTKIFRYGGTSCTANYTNNNFNFAKPRGSTGIAVPSGSTTTRLEFAHRRAFESGYDGGTLALSIDGTNYYFVSGTNIIAGQGYNGTINNACPPPGAGGASVFTGTQSSFVSTTVDLDAVCNAITGGTGGCAGRNLHIAFTSITDCTATDDGWFLDDVKVTACTP